MRYTIFSVLLLFCCVVDLSAQSILDWQSYTSFRSVSDITEDSKGRIWMTTEGGVLVTENSKVIKTLTPIQELARLDGSTIIYSEELKKIFIGYLTGEIDVVDENDFQVEKLTDIKRNNSFSQKAINDFYLLENSLFVATDFGLVEYNLNGLFVKDTYTKFGNFNTAIPVNTILEDSGVLYLGTEEGIAFTIQDGSFSSSDWENYTDSDGYTSESTEALGFFDNELYASTLVENYKLTDGTWGINSEFGNAVIVDYKTTNNFIIALSEEMIYHKEGTQNFHSSSLQGSIGTVISREPFTDTILFGTRINGLGILDLSNDTISYETQEGPYVNFFEGLNFYDGVLISGSTRSSSRREEIDKTRGFYIFENGEWENYNEIITPDFQNVVYRQPFKTTASENYYYFGSWGTGVVRFDKETDEIKLFDETNSTLRGWPQDNELYPVISGLETDSNNDVWLVSRYGNTPLYRQTPGDDDWQQFQENSAVSSSDLYENLFIDSFDQKWIALQNAQSSGTGLLVIDTKNPEDESDDVGVKLQSGTNSGNLPDSKVNVIVEDKNGEVWIGTSRGIAKFIFPELIVEGSIQERTAQWLINEDTSAVSRFLLRDVNATAMAVNAANEKWIGSANQGIYLLNAEGSKILKRFTMDNSPLFSNSIKSIAINDVTGEVFIGTDVGLISYQGIPNKSVSKMEELKVFPNPFSYKKNDLVFIEGLSDKTIVKVLGVDGMVVNSFTTNGGRVSWDGRDSTGGMLGSGVYFVVAVDSEGNSKGVGKVVIVR
ncbi:MAG: two-component regulator propeller domain-containing protein [Balneola sp.]